MTESNILGDMAAEATLCILLTTNLSDYKSYAAAYCDSQRWENFVLAGSRRVFAHDFHETHFYFATRAVLGSIAASA